MKIYYALVTLTTYTSRCITATGELECYIHATSEEEARKIIKSSYADHGVEIVFPDMGDDDVQPPASLMEGLS